MLRWILKNISTLIFYITLAGAATQSIGAEARDPTPKTNEMSAEEKFAYQKKQAQLALDMKNLETRMQNAITQDEKINALKEALTLFPTEKISGKAVGYLRTWLNDKNPAFKTAALSNEPLLKTIEDHIANNSNEFSSRYLALIYGGEIAAKPPLARGTALIEKLLNNPQSAELGILMLSSSTESSNAPILSYFDSPKITGAFSNILKTKEPNPAKSRLIKLIDHLNAQGYSEHPYFKNPETQTLIARAVAKERSNAPKEKPVSTSVLLEKSCALILQYLSNVMNQFKPVQ